MHVERAVFRHGGETAANLVLKPDELAVRGPVETGESKFAAGFVHLLRDAAAKVVQFAIELLDFVFVVGPLEGSGGKSTVKVSGAIDDIGDLFAQGNTRMYRP